MEFLEERLTSARIMLGAAWSDSFAVEVVTTAAGNEYRRLVHPFPRRRITLRWTRTNEELWDEVLNLYMRAFGRYAGFRVKAWDDFTSNNQTDTPTNTDQVLTAITAGTTYQLVNRYGSGNQLSIGRPYRVITKPVTGTVVVAVNGTPKTSGWSVSSTTGVITFSPAINPADVVTAGFEFDTPMRFDSELQLNALSSTGLRETAEIELVELFNP